MRVVEVGQVHQTLCKIDFGRNVEKVKMDIAVSPLKGVSEFFDVVPVFG